MGIKLQHLIPKRIRRFLLRATRWPRVGKVNWGHLRRVEPFSRAWGADRGRPIDRFYIDGFLSEYSADIRGVVLEIGNDRYCRLFGGGEVERCEVFHAGEGNEKATWVGDLSDAPHVPADRFDCVILTQTLQLIPDVSAAMSTIFRILKPGGVLLMTTPCISKLAYFGQEWQDYWRFTDSGIERVLSESGLKETGSIVKSQGNVLAAISFLMGLCVEDLSEDELRQHDPLYPVVVVARGIKPLALD